MIVTSHYEGSVPVTHLIIKPHLWSLKYIILHSLHCHSIEQWLDPGGPWSWLIMGWFKKYWTTPTQLFCKSWKWIEFWYASNYKSLIRKFLGICWRLVRRGWWWWVEQHGVEVWGSNVRITVLIRHWSWGDKNMIKQWSFTYNQHLRENDCMNVKS